MKRSVWKVPFISNLFFTENFYKTGRCFSRNSVISNFFLKKKLIIYSGRFWFKILIQKSMIGFKMGEFSITKIFGSAISESMAKKSKDKIRAKVIKK